MDAIYTTLDSHAALAAFVCLICIGLAGITKGSWSLAFKVGAFAFGFMSAVVLALMIVEGMTSNINSLISAQSEWMRMFSMLDDEGRAAVAYQFPTMRYTMKRGIVRAYFEDTNVPIEMFRLFLQTSNDRYISPQRDWGTREQPEWAWLEIYQWLADNDKITPGSAAGNTSHLWKGNSYQHLMAYWMVGRRIENMNERAYAGTD